LSTWLSAWRNRDQRVVAAPIMELMVLEGRDAGNQFTLEGDNVLIGRGAPETGITAVIRLEDKSISRRQAWIRREANSTSIEHIESAANPTLVNGEAISRVRLTIGDRIEMGRVIIDVRARNGTNLHGLTAIMVDAARQSTNTGTSPSEKVRAEPKQARANAPGEADNLDRAKHLAGEETEIRPIQVHLGELVILRGVEPVLDTSFPIYSGTTRIGRGDGVEIQIPELGVSRLHAEIDLVGQKVMLTTKSSTNATLVNGLPVREPIELTDGDEIQLADLVVLGVSLASVSADRILPPGNSGSDLSRRMEHKIALDREIEEFNLMGSFVDVDVVGSRSMKGGGERAEHIIVSFERFRAYVGAICEEWNGQVLNSNGDELMCFFETAGAAVLAGSAILERLADFNQNQNLLSKDFRFRLGVHTGLSLVDLDAGIAYSEVLDAAGHIQKIAEPNTLVISQRTVDSLPDTIPTTQVAEMTGDGWMLYRVDRFLRPSDFGES
jgi:pSer/pThr/pTyr-binding forkhead associated (FHA) protein